MLMSSKKDEFHFIPTYSYKEFWIPLITAIFISIMGSFPYWYGYHTAGKDNVFMGMVGRGTHASFGYLMFQRQAMEGKVGLRNQCTPEKLPNRYFNPEWWIMGRFAYWCGLSLIHIHHIDRVLATFMFTLSAYYMLCVVLESFSLRLFVFCLITFGSGLGWIVWLVNYILGTSYPITWDMQGVQAFGYMVNKPHFIRAFAMATLMYAYLIRGFQTGSLGYFILSGLAGLIHLIIRPYYIPETFVLYTVLPLIYCWLIKKWDKSIFYYCGVALIIHLPALLYYVWFAIDDPLGMRGWSVKDHFLGKPGQLIEYVLGIGWTFLCCILSFLYLLKRCKQRLTDGMVFIWMFVSWIFCNLYPYWKLGQEAGLNVFWVASPMLAIIGTGNWVKEQINTDTIFNEKFTFVKKRWVQLGVCLSLLFLSLPTTIYVYTNMFTSLKNGHPIWTYTVSKDMFDSFHWLNKNTPEDSVVLATTKTSQFLFAHTHCKTVTGSFILTVNFAQKDADVNRFFSEVDCDMFKREVLNKYKVNYIFFGPYERQLSAGRIPPLFEELQPVFTQGDTTIYKVVLNKMETSQHKLSN